MSGGMTDEDLFGGSGDDAAASSAGTPTASSGDPAIWTVLGEAGADPEGQKAVASTIANRAKRLGVTAADVVDDPNMGYEAWAPKNRATVQQRYPISSKDYDSARANVEAILSGQQPAPYAYDSFYSPSAQKALGRPAPGFDDGSGVNIGGNLFFAGKFQGAPILSDEDKAQWEALQGDRNVAITPTAQTPEPGAPASGQADAAKFLKLHGFMLEDAAPGSSQNPVYETATSGPPTLEGSWYVDRTGALRQVGSDVPDYLPAYRRLVAEQATAKAQPLLKRVGAGLGQGVNDIGASVNNLIGGALSASPEGQFAGESYTAPVDRAAAQAYEAARNRFDLRRGPDMAATVGRVVGNIAGSAPFMAAGEGVLGALGGGLARAVPAVAPVLEFLGGNAGKAAVVGGAKTGGNLLIRAPSLGLRGAQEGAGAAALTSAASDQPLAEQMRHGAVLGSAVRAAIPAVAATGNRLLTGNASITPDVANLADAAVGKYGIPLRRTQILGAGDRATAIRDSEMIGQPGTGYAENQAAQRQAFTRAVAGTFGENADALTPDVMSRAKARIGGEFDRVADKTTITDTNALQAKLQQAISDAEQVLPDSDVAPLRKQVENIQSTIKDGVLSGDSYQALTRKGSPLERATESANPNIRHYAQELKGALDDALSDAASPEDAQALAQAKWQYKNLMTVKNLAAKANVSGEISPTLLNGAVNTNFKNRAFQGAGDLGELAQIGQTFLKEPPQSGTAPRIADMIKRNMLLGGVGVGEGVAAYLHDPGVALKVAGAGAAAAAAKGAQNYVFGAYNRASPVVNQLIRRGQAGSVDQLAVVRNRLLDLASPTYIPFAVSADRNRLFPIEGSPR